MSAMLTLNISQDASFMIHSTHLVGKRLHKHRFCCAEFSVSVDSEYVLYPCLEKKGEHTFLSPHTAIHHGAVMYQNSPHPSYAKFPHGAPDVHFFLSETFSGPSFYPDNYLRQLKRLAIQRAAGPIVEPENRYVPTCVPVTRKLRCMR